jgi:hypothetical protein
MRKLLTFLIALGAVVFAVISPARSASSVLMLGAPQATRPSYRGPGDVTSVAARDFYSAARAYSSVQAAATANMG